MLEQESAAEPCSPVEYKIEFVKNKIYFSVSLNILLDVDVLFYY